MPDVQRPEWLAQVTARYQRPLCLYARRLLGSEHAAQDAVQETFLKLCEQSPATLNGSLVPWLYTVCRSRAMDALRKQRRGSRCQVEAADNLQSYDDPAQAAEANDSTSQILKLLGALPANQQEVLRLKFQHALSYREIAAITELTETNVGFLIHTGLKTIREKLRKTGELD